MPVTIGGSGPITGVTSINTTVSDTELGYLDGVTSAIQSQINTAGGLVKITDQSFSAASAVNVNNCFTSTYANYLIILNATTSTGADIFYRNRLSGTDATSTYYWQQLEGTGSTVAAQRTSNTGQILGTYSPGATGGWFSLTVINPNSASPTKFISTVGRDDTTPVVNVISAAHNVNTAYDGFTVYPSAGNMTGTLRVYGYRN